MSEIDVAVVGATGAVGEIFLQLLEDRKFPLGRLVPLASERSVGQEVSCQGRTFIVEDANHFDFSTVDMAFFSAGSDVARALAPKAVAAGCVVIDNSSAFRGMAEVPLIVPEINPVDMMAQGKPKIVANPNCATIPLCIALAPLLNAYGVESAQVVTFQSVSGSGRSGVATLAQEAAAVLNGQAHQSSEQSPFSAQIAFNVVPFIDQLQDNGFTGEEMKLFWETKKILNDDQIKVSSTTVRVPVFFGHSAAVTVQLRSDFDLEHVQTLLTKAPGLVCVDAREDSLTPVTHAVDSDAVFLSRLRRDLANERSLCFWLVSDNLRKGAALNAIQIAECIVSYQEKVLH